MRGGNLQSTHRGSAASGGTLLDETDVRIHGALVDGVTDDSAALLKALTVARCVLVPSGTLLCKNVSCPSNRTIKGVGKLATTLKIFGLTGTMFTAVNKTAIEFMELTLDGNYGVATSSNGIVVSAGSTDITAYRCRIKGFAGVGLSVGAGCSSIAAILCDMYDNNYPYIATDSDSLRVLLCDVHHNREYGILFASSTYPNTIGCSNVLELGNHVHHNNNVGMAAVGGRDHMRVGNLAHNNGLVTSGGFGRANMQFNHTTRALYVGNISYGASAAGLDLFTSPYSVAVGNISYNNAMHGLEIDSGSHFTTAVGNNVYGNSESGITVFLSNDVSVIGNNATDNGGAIYPKAGIHVSGASQGVTLIGNNASGSATTNPINIESGSTVEVMIGNKVTPYASTPVYLLGTLVRARDNIGFVTQNKGTGTIASGTTSVTLNHGLNVTPVAANFNITLTALSTLDAADIYITAITSTQFTVYCRTNPSTSGLNFGWKVDAY